MITSQTVIIHYHETAAKFSLNSRMSSSIPESMTMMKSITSFTDFLELQYTLSMIVIFIRPYLICVFPRSFHIGNGVTATEAALVRLSSAKSPNIGAHVARNSMSCNRYRLLLQETIQHRENREGIST